MTRDYQISIKQVDNGYLVQTHQNWNEEKNTIHPDAGSMLQRVKDYVTQLESTLLLTSGAGNE